MIDALALFGVQATLVILCSFGIYELAKKSEVNLNFPIAFILVFSLLHISPVISFLILGKPNAWLFSLILIILALFGLSKLTKENLLSILEKFLDSRLTVLSLCLVLLVRIVTLPEHGLVRGDIVSHIVSISEWEKGMLGYPGVDYPRGFHGIFLCLSLGQDYHLVSNSLFILLMSTGWLFFAGILRNHLDDSASSVILLLAGGAGIVGLPDGLIENTGWWLVRQSNLQPEVSAWVFVVIIMWLIDNDGVIEKTDKNVKLMLFSSLISGASVTNPFFFMVCSPFLFFWCLITYRFSYGQSFPEKRLQYFLLITPVTVLVASAVIMELTSLRFEGTMVDIHDSTHRHELLVEELGVYYTSGINFETILVLLSPKTELTIGELTLGKLVKLVLLPVWFIGIGIFFSDFNKCESLVFSATVVVLYLTWYWGVPAPDGWSVIRAQYPHRSFAMILLLFIFKKSNQSKEIPIIIGTLIWLSIEPERYYDSIFRYEHSSRAIIACISFLSFYKIQDYLPKINFDLVSVKSLAPVVFSMTLFGFWCSFNLSKFPNSDFGLMFMISIFAYALSLAYNRNTDPTLLAMISLISISAGILCGHIYDLSIGNYHQSSFILISFFAALLLYNIIRFETIAEFSSKYSMNLLLILLIINSLFHILDPEYVTPLMIPGFPDNI